MMIDGHSLARLQRWLEGDPDAAWVVEVWLFGSRAKGTARADSDVDLAFVLRDEPGRTAEGEFICMHSRWNAALTPLLGLQADVWWSNDPESVIVAPAVSDHGVLLWKRD